MRGHREMGHHILNQPTQNAASKINHRVSLKSLPYYFTVVSNLPFIIISILEHLLPSLENEKTL